MSTFRARTRVARARPRTAKSPTRLGDVARLARVSTATVSRTINETGAVSEATRRKVLRAVQKLHYYPNAHARSLALGRSNQIGLLVSDIANPFFPELIQGFEDVAVANGYEILVSSTNYDPKRMALCIRRMLERKVEGVAVMTFGIEQPLLEQLAERNIPLVFVDLGPERPTISLLKVDYHHGIRQGVQHLAALGHRNISFISGPKRLHSAQSRLDAFTKSLGECGIPLEPEWVIEGDHTLEGGIQAMEKLLAGKRLPTAVMCSNDMTAIGVMREAYDHGIKIPTDMSVVGFDDIRLAQFMIPPLTTVQMSQKELAQIAFRALLNEVDREAPSTQKSEYELNTNLILRRSTAMALPPSSR